jgi:hypothetical protein
MISAASGFVRIAGEHLNTVGKLSTLGQTLAKEGVPTASAVKMLGIQAPLASAREAVTALRAAAPHNVHVDVGSSRVLLRLDSMVAKVNQGALPLDRDLALAKQFLSWIPG